MRINLTLALPVIFLIQTLPAQPANAKSSDKPSAKVSMKQAASADSTSQFAFGLFHRISQGLAGNVLVSPLSAYLALSMTLNGAAGSTQQEMAHVLGTPAGALSDFNQHNTDKMAQLTHLDQFQLEIANAIYADTRSPFKRSFVNICTGPYHAEAHNMDFGNADVVAKAINGWCSQKTHGKIPSIVSDGIIRASRMVLVNAVYFKAAWDSKFKASNTHDDDFTTSDGAKKTVKMMHQVRDYSFYAGKNFTSIAMPYVGGNQSLYVFLPNKDVSLPAFMANFNSEDFRAWKQQYHSTRVDLALPKFKVEFTSSLKDALIAMGMPQAFTASANFSNMTDRPLAIGDVLQKTYMDVAEQGTEAAAVTAIVMLEAAAYHAPEPAKEFHVNRPFAIALVDERTDDILFIGSVVNP
jgi:serpin B